MKMHVLEARIAELLKDELAVEAPTPTTDLVRAGLLDSLLLATLLVSLERELAFRVRIEELDLDQIRTVAGLARLVAGQAGQAGPTGPEAVAAREAS